MTLEETLDTLCIVCLRPAPQVALRLRIETEGAPPADCRICGVCAVPTTREEEMRLQYQPQINLRRLRAESQ